MNNINPCFNRTKFIDRTISTMPQMHQNTHLENDLQTKV